MERKEFTIAQSSFLGSKLRAYRRAKQELDEFVEFLKAEHNLTGPGWSIGPGLDAFERNGKGENK